MSEFQVLLYYRYNQIDEPEAFVAEHRVFCEELELRGRILIGHEGINGTVSGLTEHTQRYMDALLADERTAGIEFKVDPAEDHVFPKLSVKYRSEIVTLGLDPATDIDPNQTTGKHLTPEEWYAAMQDEDVVILDGRNNYESALGNFKGAICPDVPNFRDFPAWIRKNLADAKDKKVLTYCTGGIRCEKLSGFLIEEGFKDVSQLDGGIVKYSKDPATAGKDFDGLCYVFDERVGVEVNHTDTREIISHCIYCGEESSRYRNCGWPPCNDQVFLCPSCEETKGKFCCAEHKANRLAMAEA